MTNPLAAIDEDFLRFRDHGDAAALARVFDALAPRLLLLAAHLAHDAAQCEDLVQAVFVDAMRDAAQYDGRRSVASWLAGILRHRAVDLVRSERSRGAAGESRADLEALVGSERDPLDAAQDSEWFERVAAAIERIDEPYRAVLALRLVHGLEPRAIAHALGRAPGAVRMQLLRGLEKLRVLLPAERVLGLAAFATFTAGESARGLAAVRAEVLTGSTSALPAATVAGGAFLGGWLGAVVASAAAVAIAASIWLSGNGREETRASQLVAGGGADAASEAATEPSGANAGATTLAGTGVAERTAVVASYEGAIEESPVAAAAQDEVRIVGRVLLPDGSPASAKVVVRAFALDERGVAHAAANFDGDMECSTDADGRFEAKLAAVGPYLVNAVVRCVPYSEYWVVHEGYGFEREPTFDLGDVRLKSGGRVVGRVVDAAGRPLDSSQRVTLAVASRERFDGFLSSVREDLAIDPDTGSFASGILPTGAAVLSLSGDSEPQLHEVVIEAGDQRVDFVWRDREAKRSITAQLRFHLELLNPFEFAFDARHVRLERDGQLLDSVPTPGIYWGGFDFLDVVDGDHAVLVDDPRFQPARVDDVEVGQRIDVVLRGAAAVFARVRGKDGTLSRDHRTSLQLSDPQPTFTGVRSWLDVTSERVRQPDGESYPELPCVPLTLRFDAEGCTPQLVTLTTLERGATARVEVFLVEDRGIRGVVTDAGGAPVAGVRVRARASRTDGATPFEVPLDTPGHLIRAREERELSDEHETRSDELGRFVLLGVPDIAHDVEARSSDWTLVRSTASRPGDELHLRLPPHTTARGRLVGVPPDRLKGFFVSLVPLAYEQANRRPLRWPFEKRVPPGAVDEQGAFELLGVPLEPVELFLHYPMWIERTGSWSPGVAYRLGTFDPRTTSLDGLVFDVSRFGPARVSVTVTCNGEPLAGAKVEFLRLRTESAAANYAPRCTLDADGRAEVELIDANSWCVSVSDDERGFSAVLEDDFVITAGEVRHIDAAFEVFSGTLEIVGADGESLVGREGTLWSWAIDSSSPVPRSVKFDSLSPTFTLPAGRHALSLQRLDRYSGPSVEFEWTASGPSVERIVLLEEP